MGAVVPAHNLPGNPELRFSQATIADIFLGRIREWDDPGIAAGDEYIFGDDQSGPQGKHG
jgi:ABC-type phosphate transport system substrate-binding protein